MIIISKSQFKQNGIPVCVNRRWRPHKHPQAHAPKTNKWNAVRLCTCAARRYRRVIWIERRQCGLRIFPTARDQIVDGRAVIRTIRQRTIVRMEHRLVHVAVLLRMHHCNDASRHKHCQQHDPEGDEKVSAYGTPPGIIDVLQQLGPCQSDRSAHGNGKNECSKCQLGDKWYREQKQNTTPRTPTHTHTKSTWCKNIVIITTTLALYSFYN